MSCFKKTQSYALAACYPHAVQQSTEASTAKFNLNESGLHERPRKCLINLRDLTIEAYTCTFVVSGLWHLFLLADMFACTSKVEGASLFRVGKIVLNLTQSFEKSTPTTATWTSWRFQSSPSTAVIIIIIKKICWCIESQRVKTSSEDLEIHFF